MSTESQTVIIPVTTNYGDTMPVYSVRHTSVHDLPSSTCTKSLTTPLSMLSFLKKYYLW